jgi:hypothetical protein
MLNTEKNLLKRVKAAGEDFEWYPTTWEMLEVVAADICKEIGGDYHEKTRRFSILDIGAGNGNALKTICEITKNEGEKYAIEKSRVLLDSLPSDVFVIGTDFHQQTLIDKRVDVVFCNPPYSEYETWMRRIVAEANCRLIYLVVPERWKENKAIANMIARRLGEKEEDPDTEISELRARIRYENSCLNGICKVIGSDTFEDSEFRQARARVDILKIRPKIVSTHSHDLEVDPFDIWYDETFSINADKVDDRSAYEEGCDRASALHELVVGKNIIERLDELYHADMDKLFTVYKSLESFDAALFKELGVDMKQVKGGLRAKISGLKALYWQELFSNLDTLTDRLTSKSRKALLDKLTAHTSIDFTADNAYAVVVWAIKNSNAYFDEQLRAVYLELADQENVRNFKSNHRVITDEWRFCKKEMTHFTLDYRLVLDRRYCFGGYEWELKRGNGLSPTAHELLTDICTIAKNLGFDIGSTSMDFQWEPGRKVEFLFADGRLFMDVRAFNKGTMHLRMDQAFMRKLNIEAARLNGWVKSPAEAAEETGIDDAAALYGTNFKMKSIKLLAGASA